MARIFRHAPDLAFIFVLKSGRLISHMLASSPDQRRFFGMDVSRWPSQWAAAGDLLLRSRALRWLSPSVRMELTQASGQPAFVDMEQGLARPAVGSVAASARAIELLPEQVLRRQLALPRLGKADLARAVALEVAAITPFPLDRTVSAFAVLPGEGDTVKVDLALTSAQEIDKRLQAVKSAEGTNPEVWVLPDGANALNSEFVPLIFQGYGGAERRRLMARGLSLRGSLLALALLLLAGLAVTPTAQTRLRAIQAQGAFDQLSKEAAPQLAQREKIVKQTERLQSIAKLAEQQLAPLPVLDMLTRQLPDGAWLSNWRLEGGKVIINGVADDTAALVRGLGNQSGVLGVRSPSPATRVSQLNKESFTLELTLDPAVFGLLRKGAAP